jgi:primosomal protein N' (replication factor Y) (superfamily II helicase)
MPPAMTDSAQTVEILLPLALPGTYTYAVPEGMALKAGDYVAVPLGPRNYIGCVWQVPGRPEPGVELRKVIERYDLPAMPAHHRAFVDWIAAYYLEPKGNVLRLALRAPGVFAGEWEAVAYRWGGAAPVRMTPQRERVLAIAREGIAMRARELADEAGVGVTVVKALAGQGALEAVALPMHRPFAAPKLGAGFHVLSPRQEEAARALRSAVAQRGPSVTLLDGVTGSGKTEVYFEAMAAALAAGQQVLLLLPEIALTAQFLQRVEQRFGAEPAQWHSSVRPRERERVWRAVASGEARIVVGARSALFLPWARPGLIVVDEEHEGAYKQEDGVPYHARDMAVVYGNLARFPVILSSATPSLETLVNVERGRYGHVELASRHGMAELPETQIIDMRSVPVEQGDWLSEPLAQAVAQTLESGDQALLFLNRRGYAPLTLCRACGHRFECPNCSASLVEHRFRRQLMCHHCGHIEPVPRSCPACGAEDRLVPCGPGVERLAEEAGRRFPDAKLAILSSDLARGTSLIDAIRDVAQGKFNLVIGTQLVAKGHHFPHLTLAAVVDADFALESGDPRSGERTWQLLAQVAGRAGRGEKRGRALIQTYRPDHPLMIAITKGDRQGFMNQEKHLREAGELPPYGRLAAIIVSGRDAHATERFAKAIARERPSGEGIHVLGPAPAPLHLVRGLYRWRFLIKAKRDVNLQAFIEAWLTGIKPTGSLRMSVDIDPYSFV